MNWKAIVVVIGGIVLLTAGGFAGVYYLSDEGPSPGEGDGPSTITAVPPAENIWTPTRTPPGIAATSGSNERARATVANETPTQTHAGQATQGGTNSPPPLGTATATPTGVPVETPTQSGPNSTALPATATDTATATAGPP